MKSLELLSMMASDAMGRLTASVWRKSGVIGSFKRPGWIGPIFLGWLNSYRNGVDFWGLLPTLQEWLNLKIIFQCKLICHECKADSKTYMRPTLHAERYSIYEFWDHCLKPGPVCSLAWTFFLLRSVRALFYHQFFKVISLRGMCSSRQLPTRSSATNSPLPDVYDKMVCYACDPSWMWLMAGWQCSQKFIAGYNFVWGWMWWWTSSECLAWV